MTVRLSYNRGVTAPSARLWIFDDDGTLIDLTGATLSVKIGARGATPKTTKASGVTGGLGAGTEPDGTPNVTIVWSGSELDIAPGIYLMQVIQGSNQRIWECEIEIKANIT